MHTDRKEGVVGDERAANSAEASVDNMAQRQQMARIDPDSQVALSLHDLNDDVQSRIVQLLSGGDFASIAKDIKAYCRTNTNARFFCEQTMETNGTWRKLLVVFGLPPDQIQYLPSSHEPFRSWRHLWMTLCDAFETFKRQEYHTYDPVSQNSRAKMTGKTDLRDQLLDPNTPPLFKAAFESHLRHQLVSVGSSLHKEALQILLRPAKRCIDESYGVKGWPLSQLKALKIEYLLWHRINDHNSLLDAICNLTYNDNSMLGNAMEWGQERDEVQWAADVLGHDKVFGGDTCTLMSAPDVVRHLVKDIGVFNLLSALTLLVERLNGLKEIRPFTDFVSPSNNSFFHPEYKDREILAIFDTVIDAVLDLKQPGIIRMRLDAVEFMTIQQRIRWRNQIHVPPNTPSASMEYPDINTDVLYGGDPIGDGVLNRRKSIRDHSWLREVIGQILREENPVRVPANPDHEVMSFLRKKYDDRSNKYRREDGAYVYKSEFSNYRAEIATFVRLERLSDWAKKRAARQRPRAPRG